MDDLCFLPAGTIARLIRAKEVSAVEVVEAHARRIEAVNPRINAIVQAGLDEARDAAKQADDRLASGAAVGPLHGVPVTIKDAFEVRGLISSAGTLGRARFRPERDATPVRRLRDAGAIILGKTNVPELAQAHETTNLVYGTTNNPYDLERTSGGSSGGPAAAVAAGLSALDVGSDGGGSIRIPASFCGVAALKASTGRIPGTGHFPVCSGIGNALVGYGPIARSAADVLIGLRVLEGEDPDDPVSLPIGRYASDDLDVPKLRVAYFVDYPERDTEPAVAEAVRESARQLERAGCQIVEQAPPDLDDAAEIHLGLVVLDRKLMREWVRVAGTQELHPWLAAGLDYLDEAAADLSPDAPNLFWGEWLEFRAKALRFMQDFDILLSPTSSFPAPRHGEGASAASYDGYAYSLLHNVTGWPAATVRCGTSPDGLPIGVQIAARPMRDLLTLRVAAHLEQLMGGFKPPPDPRPS